MSTWARRISAARSVTRCAVAFPSSSSPGAAPFTLEGELPGGRNEFIHWIQDVRDQRGILRNYVKYDNEIRTGRNVKQLVHRALQISRSEPAGPVYLISPREVMEEPVQPYAVDRADFGPVAPVALTDEVTAEIATALAQARHPLIVTSYLGRDPAAVPELVELCELLAIPVLESMAYHVNFPADHELHAGFQYHTVAQNPVLAQADVILVIDSDVPWIPAVNRPSAGAAIYCVDVDPLKAADEHVARARAALRRGQLAGGGGADHPVRSGQCPARRGRGRGPAEEVTAASGPGEPHSMPSSSPVAAASSRPSTLPRACGGCWPTRTRWS